MSGPLSEPGSFRDRTNGVFYLDGRVYRGLTADALADWRRLLFTRFFQRAEADGRIVRTREVDLPHVPPRSGLEPWAGFLEHDRVPFVSYPYEWCFGMLRDAAASQLELLEEALGEGLTLKDASPYNTQFIGARPVFVDVGSFERRRSGDPWSGYEQFCRLFLNPLLLQAHRGVPFQPWLRGSLEGLGTREAGRLLHGRDRLRPGVFKHVLLHGAMQDRYANTQLSVRRDVRGTGLDASVVAANVRSLQRLVSRLRWEPPRTAWSGYAAADGYESSDRSAKKGFVDEVLRSSSPRLVWDLGCNRGVYAKLAAETGAYVVALDSDPAVVELLYRDLKAEGRERVLPLVWDVADPSPALGWRGRERKPLAARGRPELSFALALLHHLVIGANVPLAEVVDWLADVGSDLVVEFVGRDDPMVQRLLRDKDDAYADYDSGFFEERLAGSFDVVAREALGSETRVLYYARARSRTPAHAVTTGALAGEVAPQP